MPKLLCYVMSLKLIHYKGYLLTAAARNKKRNCCDEKCCSYDLHLEENWFK